jgi:hypothetical protein
MNCCGSEKFMFIHISVGLETIFWDKNTFFDAHPDPVSGIFLIRDGKTRILYKHPVSTKLTLWKRKDSNPRNV